MSEFTVTSERKDIYHVVKEYATHCRKKLDSKWLSDVINDPPRGPRLYITAHGKEGPEGFAVLTFFQEPRFDGGENVVKAYLEVVCANEGKGAGVVRAVIAAAARVGADFIQLSAANKGLIPYYRRFGFTQEPNACMPPLTRAQLKNTRLPHQYFRRDGKWSGFIAKALDPPRKFHENGESDGYFMSRCMKPDDTKNWILPLLERGTKGTLRFPQPIRKYFASGPV